MRARRAAVHEFLSKERVRAAVKEGAGSGRSPATR
jgi:hypothetical protein